MLQVHGAQLRACHKKALQYWFSGGVERVGVHVHAFLPLFAFVAL